MNLRYEVSLTIKVLLGTPTGLLPVATCALSGL